MPRLPYCIRGKWAIRTALITSWEKPYSGAFVQYDKAVSMGKTDLGMYQVRTQGRMKMMQDKYKTNNTQELRSEMSANEKVQLCTELKKAISLGLNDMKQEMFASLVCK